MTSNNYLNFTGLQIFFNRLQHLFATKDVATLKKAGLMSVSDKLKLDELSIATAEDIDAIIAGVFEEG